MQAFALEGQRGWPWGNPRIEGVYAKLKSFVVMRLHVIQCCVENRHKVGMCGALGCRWYSRHDGLR